MKRSFMAVIAAAMLAMSPAMAQDPVKICTGGTGGNYYPAGKDIKAQMTSKIPFEVVATKGSMDNFERLANGECQYAIVQSDAVAEWTARGKSEATVEEINGLYTEVFHMVYNTKAAPGVNGVFGKMDKNVTVMRDHPDSGTAVVWENLRRGAKKAGVDRVVNIPTLPQGGIGAIGKLRSGNEAQAMIFVSGMNSNLMKRVNAQALDDKGQHMLCLVDMDDSGTFSKATWERTLNSRGRPMYKEAKITNKDINYAALMCGRSSITTFSTEAVVVANRDWKEKHPEVAEAVAEAIELAVPNIVKRMKAN